MGEKISWFLILFSGLVILLLVFFAASGLDFFWRLLLSIYGGLTTTGMLLVLFEE